MEKRMCNKRYYTTFKNYSGVIITYPKLTRTNRHYSVPITYKIN